MVVKLLIIIAVIISIFIINRYITAPLTRFCLYTPIKTFVFSLLLSCIFWSISNIFLNENYIEAYYEIFNKDILLFPFFICTLCCISSYSIFLCKIKPVRNNYFYSFASFFILPLVIAYAVIGLQYNFMKHIQQIIYYSFAFILPQSYYYRVFLKKRGNFD